MSKLTTSGLMFRGHPVCFFEEIPDPPTPTLPPFTIRVKFTSEYIPTMGDSQTLVDAVQNIWDITKNNTSWANLFRRDTSLLEILGANVSSVTDMLSTFENCTSLTTISLFDTSSVTSMSSMFYGCTSLITVPLFNTSSVVDMTATFFNCTSLTTIPLFNTSSVTNMDYTFRGCINVQSGALALYQQASTQATPPSNHTQTFRNCGSNTTTGAAELAQIPSSWK